MVEIATALTPVNTILIIGTLLLGFYTHRFQRKTSLRESLEQLDSVWVQRRDDYIGVLLHDFDWVPLLRNESVVEFYARRMTNDEKANVGEPLDAEEVFDDYGMTIEVLQKFDHVTDVTIEEKGVFLMLDTTDPVVCRNVVEHIQHELKHKFRHTN